MARTYRECPACGRRALTIATRCPGCAHEFAGEAVRRPPSRATARLIPGLAIGGILLVLGGVVTLAVRRAANRDPAPATSPEVQAAATVAPATSSASSPAPPAIPDSAPSAEAVPRVARTWTKVRAGRSTTADVVAVLLPGDTVLVDSLKGGWWRVSLDGRVLGYVFRRTLVRD
jgi:Bacterial SH3 domain